MPSMERLTISLPAQLAADFDQWIEKRGYTNRSEAVRDLVRGTLASDLVTTLPDLPSVASLAYVYDHHDQTVSGRLAKAQHQHHGLVVATVHAHLDHERCLEVSILRGPAAELGELANAITALKGIRNGRLHLIAGESETVHGAHSHD